MKPKSDTHTHTLETHRTSAEQRFTVRRLTDVDEVAMSVQHDVSIVSVLDLQQEQQQTVRSHATDEVIPRLMNTRERERERDGEKHVSFKTRPSFFTAGFTLDKYLCYMHSFKCKL